MEHFLLSNISWWYWVVFGIILALLELFTFTFFLLIFGVSAVVVGVLTLIFEFSLNMEIALWLGISILSILGLYPIYKKKVLQTHTSIGQSDGGLGTKGVILEEVNVAKRGKVKLYEAIHGSKVWLVEADSTLESGTEVEVVAVSGQILKVK
jgi:membrane protein implicated in regulation of membrane protease activity